MVSNIFEKKKPTWGNDPIWLIFAREERSHAWGNEAREESAQGPSSGIEEKGLLVRAVTDNWLARYLTGDPSLRRMPVLRELTCSLPFAWCKRNAQGHIGCLVPSWQRETTSITSCCDILWYQALRFKDLFASLRSWVVSAPWSSLKNAWQA